MQVLAVFRQFSLFAGMAVMMIAGGCGSSDAWPTATVSGAVTFEGQPVTEGQIEFFSPERGVGASAVLDSSGGFTIEQPVDVGSYKVMVKPPSMPAPKMGEPPPKMKEYQSIPYRYRDEASTDLTAEVREDEENKFTFDMKAGN